jgi:RND family efflux transporter MFP subunit
VFPRLSRTWLLRLGLVVLTAGCGRGEPPEPEEASGGTRVTTAIARIETLRDPLVLSGTVVPSLAADWTIRAPEAGTVAEITKAEGEAVTTGELLVRFDILAVTQQVQARESTLTLARQRLADARADFARMQSLFEGGLAARNAFEASRTAVTTAEAAVNQAETEMKLATVLLDAARVVARFDGVVVTRWKNEGDFATGSDTDPVLRVVDPTRTQIAIDVPLERAARLSAGMPATIDGAPGLETPVIGTVARITMPTDVIAATSTVRLNYQTPVPLALDTPVRVEIVLDQQTDAIVVPADAIQRDAQGAYVMIADADLVARRRDVRVGLTAGTLTQILQGVAAGDRVIVAGAGLLADGDIVVVAR